MAGMKDLLAEQLMHSRARAQLEHPFIFGEARTPAL
jgi:hypothetical protein